MARLKSLGFELNSTTADVEATSIDASTIQTSVVRSGTYAFQANSGFEDFTYLFKASDTQGSFFFRIYLRIDDYPAATDKVLTVESTVGTDRVAIQVTTTGTLILRNVEDSADVGSPSSALSLNTWYMIELAVDTTTLASTAVEARLDGVSFASGTVDLSGGVGRIDVGDTNGSAGFDFYVDDVAINDSTGSFQNSWPGEGEIIHLRPNAAGDNSDWTGTAGADYENIDEVTPDDATTIISSNTLNQITDVNLDDTPAGLAADDTINAVQVGVRFNTSSATSTDPTFVLRIKASASGTVEESGTITASSTSWGTNAVADPRNYALTLYDLPGASTTGWTKADLDQAQIGVRETLNETDSVQVSTLWLLVDHKPNAAPPAVVTARGGLLLLGVG